MRKKTENIKGEGGIVVKVTCTRCGTSFKTTLDTDDCVKCYMAYLRQKNGLVTPTKRK